MDGRGRALDNVFVERLWRSVKYEEVYLKDYTSVTDAGAQLALKQAWSHHASWSNKMTPCHHVCARRVGAVVESGRSR